MSSKPKFGNTFNKRYLIIVLVSIYLNLCERQLSFTKIKVYGYQYNYEVSLIKSISKFWFGRHEVTDYFAPSNQESNHNNRPGIFKKSIEYIVIHDTASVAKSADEYAHAQYVRNGGDGTIKPSPAW